MQYFPSNTYGLQDTVVLTSTRIETESLSNFFLFPFQVYKWRREIEWALAIADLCIFSAAAEQ